MYKSQATKAYHIVLKTKAVLNGWQTSAMKSEKAIFCTTQPAHDVKTTSMQRSFNIVCRLGIFLHNSKLLSYHMYLLPSKSASEKYNENTHYAYMLFYPLETHL